MRYIILSLIFALTSYSQNEDIQLNGTVGTEGNQIKNVGDPTDAQDVVTKKLFRCDNSKSSKSDR
jgi:hypothetical protein